jgi:hypothetical protein
MASTFHAFVCKNSPQLYGFLYETGLAYGGYLGLVDVAKWKIPQEITDPVDIQLLSKYFSTGRTDTFQVFNGLV